MVEEEEEWLLATLMATAMPLAIAMPLATALRMALVRCFVVVAVSAVVVERLAFAWRLWLPVAAGRCRVVAGTRVWFAICGKRACGKHAIGHN